MNVDKVLKKWVKERDQVLEKRSVEELIKFMEKWEKYGVYDKTINEQFKKASPEVQMMTLCKSICNATKISKETYNWALDKLKELKASPNIY